MVYNIRQRQRDSILISENVNNASFEYINFIKLFLKLIEEERERERERERKYYSINFNNFVNLI